MFFLILFGFYHVFLTGRTAAKNNIQFQPYRSQKCAFCLHYDIFTITGVLRMVTEGLAKHYDEVTD